MTNTEILWKFYQRFFLNLGGKKVPTPYRINLPYQKDRRKYGKWNPSKITHDTKQIAKEQSLDLDKLSINEIRDFMHKNQLGIDCSGFCYQMINYLLNKLGKGNMRKNGFPSASGTNVKILKSDKFSIQVEKVINAKTGDLIAFDHGLDSLAHVMLIMEMTDQEITFAHSADSKENNGIQTGKIIISDPAKNIKYQNWPKDLNNGEALNDYLDPELGDGIRRLKVLQ